MANSLPSQTDRIHADLRSQGGVVEALMQLGDSIDKACREVVNGVHGVAWAIDHERRGIQSTQSRQDPLEVFQNVKGLVDRAILRDGCRADLLQRLADLVVDARGSLPKEALREAAEIRQQSMDAALRDEQRAKDSSSLGNGIYGVRAAPSGSEVLRVPATPKRRKTQRSKRTKGGK